MFSKAAALLLLFASCGMILPTGVWDREFCIAQSRVFPSSDADSSCCCTTTEPVDCCSIPQPDENDCCIELADSFDDFVLPDRTSAGSPQEIGDVAAFPTGFEVYSPSVEDTLSSPQAPYPPPPSVHRTLSLLQVRLV